jgi:WD40 repeat protein
MEIPCFSRQVSNGRVYALTIVLNCVLTAGHDKVVRIFDIHSYSLKAECRGHTHLITSLATLVNLAGDILVISGSWDSSIRLWAASTGRQVGILKGHTNRVKSICVSGSSGNKLLASGGDDMFIILWNILTLEKVFQIKVAYSPLSVMLTEDSVGNTIILTTALGMIDVHEVKITIGENGDGETSKRELPFDPQPSSSVTCLALFDPTKIRDLSQDLKGFAPMKFLLSGHMDGSISMWDVASGEKMRVLVEHKHAILSLATYDHIASGPIAVSCDRIGIVILWDLVSGINRSISSSTSSRDLSTCSIGIGISGNHVNIITAGEEGVAKFYTLSVSKEDAVSSASPHKLKGKSLSCKSSIRSQSLTNVPIDLGVSGSKTAVNGVREVQQKTRPKRAHHRKIDEGEFRDDVSSAANSVEGSLVGTCSVGSVKSTSWSYASPGRILKSRPIKIKLDSQEEVLQIPKNITSVSRGKCATPVIVYDPRVGLPLQEPPVPVSNFSDVVSVDDEHDLSSLGSISQLQQDFISDYNLDERNYNDKDWVDDESIASLSIVGQVKPTLSSSSRKFRRSLPSRALTRSGRAQPLVLVNGTTLNHFLAIQKVLPKLHLKENHESSLQSLLKISKSTKQSTNQESNPILASKSIALLPRTLITMTAKESKSLLRVDM